MTKVSFNNIKLWLNFTTQKNDLLKSVKQKDKTKQMNVKYSLEQHGHLYNIDYNHSDI